MSLGPLALKAWDAMWRLYDRKYGKYGEKAVKALKRDLQKAIGQIQRQQEEIEDLREKVKDSEELATKAHAAATEYREKYNEQLRIVAARDGGVKPTDTNPFEE